MKNKRLNLTLLLGTFALLASNALADAGPPIWVPDGGSSWALLALSLVGLAGLRRVSSGKK